MPVVFKNSSASTRIRSQGKSGAPNLFHTNYGFLRHSIPLRWDDKSWRSEPPPYIDLAVHLLASPLNLNDTMFPHRPLLLSRFPFPLITAGIGNSKTW